MPRFIPDEFPGIVDHCRAMQGALAESLNLCFDTQFAITTGDPVPWDAATVPPELAGAGLLACFEVDGQGLLVILPAELPLPDWYRQPDKSQRSRMDTLPMEWSLNLLPEDFVIDNFRIVSTDHLHGVLNFCDPVVGAQLIPWSLQVPEATVPPTMAWILGPVNDLPEQVTEDPVLPPETATTQQAAPLDAATTSDDDTSRARTPSQQEVNRLRRLMKLSVPIIVTLAEKKIPLSQLLTLGPGAIVQFDKSCEDLLDLQVNNQVYCRGEAVKIGEKFGLKVTELGAGPDPALKHRGQIIQT